MPEANSNYFVFRPFPDASTGADWHDRTSPYGENDIHKIPDPEGASDKKEITSIPSPFARIHLVEQAFKVVSDLSQKNPSSLEGNTIYHKLVSDAWDVGEMFFKFDLFSKRKRLSLERWNKRKHLEELKNSGNNGHRLLGETLELYMNQDGVGSNFINIQELYYISVDFKVIGGTSPSTLFYTCANDLSFVGITQGNDTFFDKDYCPLFKRGKSFQKYIYGLFKIYSDLKSSMPYVWNYLKASLEKLQEVDPTAWAEIQKMNSNSKYDLSLFEKEYEKWKGNEAVYFFKDYEHLKKLNSVRPEDVESDFKIKSTRYNKENKAQRILPLVLENGYQRRLTYFNNGKWDPNTTVPYKDEKPLHERYLPGQDELYPYLTVSDFLEPVLIQLPYAVDDRFFFNGNPEGFRVGDKIGNVPPENTYLIPLKNSYFQFFEINDLEGKTPDGKPIFRMVKISGNSVRVELRIPIETGEYILFERLYKPSENPDESKNEGVIRKYKFSLGFLPFFSGSINSEQRVGLVDADVLTGSPESEYSLNFYKDIEGECKSLIVDEPRTRSNQAKRHEHNATSKYYIIKDSYEFIEVAKQSNEKGLVYPTI